VSDLVSLKKMLIHSPAQFYNVLLILCGHDTADSSPQYPTVDHDLYILTLAQTLFIVKRYLQTWAVKKISKLNVRRKVKGNHINLHFMVIILSLLFCATESE